MSTARTPRLARGIAAAPLESPVHHCLRCGACCAHFRVSFHWSEAQPHNPDGPPAELVEPLRQHEYAMRGTAGGRTPRCLALVGEVGVAAVCGIYAQRPSPCRALKPAYEDGEPSPQCDAARRAHGLPPLTPADWAAS